MDYYWKRFWIDDVLPAVLGFTVVLAVIGFVWWSADVLYTSWRDTPANWAMKDDIVDMLEIYPQLKADVQRHMEDQVLTYGEYYLVKAEYDRLVAEDRDRESQDEFERSIW